jgi:hypothetical protein
LKASGRQAEETKKAEKWHSHRRSGAGKGEVMPPSHSKVNLKVSLPCDESLAHVVPKTSDQVGQKSQPGFNGMIQTHSTATFGAFPKKVAPKGDSRVQSLKTNQSCHSAGKHRM